MARYRKGKNKSNNSNPKLKPDESKSQVKASSSSTGEGDSTVDDSKGENGTSNRGYNDPAWYTRFPELAFGSGNLPYGEPFGALLKAKVIPGVVSKVGNVEYTFDPDSDKYSSVGGVLSLATRPSYGLAYDRNHPLNVAAQMFYTNVRYVNSGRKNYEAADLMLYALAISELYSFIMYCQRLYGYGYMYSQRNYFINEALITSNNVIKGSLVSSLANFRYWLNAFINKVSSFAVPADISIFARRIFMYAHLYSESTTMNIKDQLYQFVPDGFYKFVLDDAGKGKLTFKPFQPVLMDIPTLITYGEDLLSNIFGDEDFGLMSGDIIKAYGSNIIGLTSLPEDVLIMPEYEEFVLSQFKNSVLVGADINKFGSTQITFTVGRDSTVQNAGDICQDGKGNLVNFNVISGTKSHQLVYTTLDHVMSVTNPIPDINDNFEASRLIVGSDKVDTSVFTFADSGTDKSYRRCLICGSDFATKVIISRYKYDANLGVVLDQIVFDSNTIGDPAAQFLAYSLAMQFKWLPNMYHITSTQIDATHTKYNGLRLISNVDNYTFVDNAMLTRLHEAALLSLTYVPGVSKVIG